MGKIRTLFQSGREFPIPPKNIPFDQPGIYFLPIDGVNFIEIRGKGRPSQGHRLEDVDSGGRTSGEDDLAAGGDLVELADVDDRVHLGAEVLSLQLEHVHRGFAGVELAAGVGDHLYELGHGRDVDLVHGLLHHRSGHGRHARDRAQPGHHVHAGIADRSDLDLAHTLGDDGVQPEEGEEEAGFNALHAGPVGHDQAGVDAVQAALGDDDGDFLDGIAHGSSGCSGRVRQTQPSGFFKPAILAAFLAGPPGKRS